MKGFCVFIVSIVLFASVQIFMGKFGDRLTLFIVVFSVQVILFYGVLDRSFQIWPEVFFFLISYFSCLYLVFSIFERSIFDAFIGLSVIGLSNYAVYRKKPNEGLRARKEMARPGLGVIFFFSFLGAPFMAILLWSISIYYGGERAGEEAVYFSLLLYGVAFIFLKWAVLRFLERRG